MWGKQMPIFLGLQIKTIIEEEKVISLNTISAHLILNLWNKIKIQHIFFSFLQPPFKGVGKDWGGSHQGKACIRKLFKLSSPYALGAFVWNKTFFTFLRLTLRRSVSGVTTATSLEGLLQSLKFLFVWLKYFNLNWIILI